MLEIVRVRWAPPPISRSRPISTNTASTGTTTASAIARRLGPPGSDATTVSCRWFQSRAAALLNYLYRRAPLPETGGIYRSRLPQSWINERRIAPFANALTGPTLDKLPVPA